jgi:hypothetical protein
MNEKNVISCDESEIIALINIYFPELQYDSIVAMEELGNQVWCTSASKDDDNFEFDEILKSKECQWHTNVILDKLCSIGAIKEGDYEIDCTW